MRYHATSLWQRVFMTSKPRTAFALCSGGACPSGWWRRCGRSYSPRIAAGSAVER